MWVYETVPHLRVGEGSVAALAEEVRALGRQAVLVAGRHLISDGTAARIASLLQGAGVEATVVTGPAGEPTLAEAAQCLASAKQAGCSVVVGLGGGSVLDISKAVAGLYHAQGEPYASISAALYSAPPDLPALPWVAVPTTAGTGSEATHVCVLSDPARGVKQSMRSVSWYAKAVVIDPNLYASAPPHVTASAGMDALTQAIEAHTSLGATPLTKALSLQATVLLANNLVRAYRDGEDMQAREATALGSCLAGMALANARLGVVHGLAHPVGMRYSTPHGLTCAVLLPYAMRFNMPVAGQGYAELAAAAGLASSGPLLGHRLLDFVVQINERMGIPAKLSALGLRAEHIPALSKEALTSGSTKANPRPVGLPDLEELLMATL